MSTKVLADKLGVTRRMRRPLIQQQSSRLVANVPSNARQNVSSSTPATRAAATRKEPAAIAAATPTQSRCCTRGQPVTSTVRSTSAPRPTVAVRVDNAPIDTRRYGQCTRCLRAISLTAAGLLRAHGPNCSGSGQPPVDGSVVSASTLNPKCTQSSAGARPCDSGAVSSSPSRSSADIMELLQHRRCRVLKRVPQRHEYRRRINWLRRCDMPPLISGTAWRPTSSQKSGFESQRSRRLPPGIVCSS